MNSNDYFASLLGDTTGGKSARRTTVVTQGTIAKVRQEQAADAFAAEREEMLAAQAALKDELDAQREACELLARDLALAREELASSREEFAAAQDATMKSMAAMSVGNAAKDDEIARLKDLLQEAQRTSLSSSVLLEKPPAFSEKFHGEAREHVLAALASAREAAEAAGRDRRARILEAVLGANPPSGELDRRREATLQILKDAGGFLDDRTISDLEKLGFRYVSGKNHHKLEWAGIRFPAAKTPSDRRSCLNTASEISNRVF